MLPLKLNTRIALKFPFVTNKYEKTRSIFQLVECHNYCERIFRPFAIIFYIVEVTKMKIIGIRPSEFKGDDGQTVTGKNIYLTYPLEKGEGIGAERVYLTTSKLNSLGYVPTVGDEVRLEYNRWGKCCGMEPV